MTGTPGTVQGEPSHSTADATCSPGYRTAGAGQVLFWHTSQTSWGSGRDMGDRQTCTAGIRNLEPARMASCPLWTRQTGYFTLCSDPACSVCCVAALGVQMTGLCGPYLSHLCFMLCNNVQEFLVAIFHFLSI